MDGRRSEPPQSPASGGSHGRYRVRPRRGFPEFSDLVLACRYHPWKTLCFGTVTSLIFSALAYLLVDVSYKAESLVRVRQHQEVVFAAQGSRADDLQFVRAQEQLALSPPVLTAALAAAELKAYDRYIPGRDASEWLKKHVMVDMQSGSEVMSIAANHPVPEVAQALCNALTQAYIREVTERFNSDQQRRLLELERAALDADRRLDSLWGELNKVASQIGSENSQSLTIRDEIQLQAYRDYSQQLRALQLRGHELVNQLADAQRGLETSTAVVSEADIEQRILREPEVLNAYQRLDQLDSQIRHMREIVANEDSPRLKRLWVERELAASEVEATLERVGPRIRQETLARTLVQTESGLQNLRKQIELNESEKEFLRHRLAEIDSGTTRSQEKSGLHLEVARHAVDRQARLADGLWQSLEELKIERQSQSRVQLMQLAGLPDSARYEKQLKAIVAVVATCWVIIVLGTGYFEWRSCTIRHTAEVIENSRFPVFGDVERTLRRWPHRGEESSHTTGAQQAVAQILLSEKQAKIIPSLMVTSAVGSEPRHLLAIDMAVAFASLRQKTLLIDFDTSSGALSRELACDSAQGLAQICAQRCEPQAYIIGMQGGIDFIPLGSGECRPAWIDPHYFVSLLRKVRNKYQAIVVSGPSILHAAEGLINAAQVDQIVFTVCGGTSRWDELAQAEQAGLNAGLSSFGSIVHSDQPRPLLSVVRFQEIALVDSISDLEAAVSDDLSHLEDGIRQALSSVDKPLISNAPRKIHS
jgi:capsular polysaccharide biosynthesis protein